MTASRRFSLSFTTERRTPVRTFARFVQDLLVPSLPISQSRSTVTRSRRRVTVSRKFGSHLVVQASASEIVVFCMGILWQMIFEFRTISEWKN